MINSRGSLKLVSGRGISCFPRWRSCLPTKNLWEYLSIKSGNGLLLTNLFIKVQVSLRVRLATIILHLFSKLVKSKVFVGHSHVLQKITNRCSHNLNASKFFMFTKSSVILQLIIRDASAVSSALASLSSITGFVGESIGADVRNGCLKDHSNPVKTWYFLGS